MGWGYTDLTRHGHPAQKPVLGAAPNEAYGMVTTSLYTQNGYAVHHTSEEGGGGSTLLFASVSPAMTRNSRPRVAADL